MNQGGIQRADADEVDADDAVLAVEHDDPKSLPVEVLEQRGHQAGYVGGFSNRLVPGGRDAALANEGEAVLRHAEAPNPPRIGRVSLIAFLTTHLSSSSSRCSR